MRIRYENTENFKIQQHSIAANQKHVRTFLAYHSIIYIVSGALHLTDNDIEQVIKEGELCLISPGTYANPELTNDQELIVFILLFNRQTAQFILKLPKVHNALNKQSRLKSWKNPDIYIIPPNKFYKSFFDSIELYHEMKNDIKKEMIPVKFTELIYLLLDSPHQQAILSFLSDAAIYSGREETRINA
ncbi:hypothetical protein [Parabacteroides sp.]